jgi:hypothetical protein
MKKSPLKGKKLTDEEKLRRSTVRYRNKTTLGKLERLRKARAVLRRRAAMTEQALRKINASIDAIAIELARAKFNEELDDHLPKT